MAAEFVRRRCEVDLKPILEELEKSFIFNLTFNSGCLKYSDYEKRCFRDFDDLCLTLRIYWELELISKDEHSKLRDYFYRILTEKMKSEEVLKEKNLEIENDGPLIIGG